MLNQEELKENIIYINTLIERFLKIINNNPSTEYEKFINRLHTLTIEELLNERNKYEKELNNFPDMNNQSKLEKMIELWEDKFLPLIDEYEDIEYILAPSVIKEKDTKYDNQLLNIKNISMFFKKTDAAFNEGYNKVIITKLQTETYNRKSPAIRISMFYIKD